MTDATEKQITFAKQLGIVEPETFSKQALKEMIDRKLKERDAKKEKTQPQASNEQIQQNQEILVITRNEKPNSYEFGKADNRHKIYYSTIEELEHIIKGLKLAGFIADFPAD